MESNGIAGHAFLSYVREDTPHADRLQHLLEASGISVWRDTAELWPGEDWRAKIREAITDNALVFIACHSQASRARARTYQNEELLVAIEQLRLRRPGDPWLIPVRFDDCYVPDLELGGGRTLDYLHRVDLFGEQYNQQAARLVEGIRRSLSRASDTTAKAAPHPSLLPQLSLQPEPSSLPLPPTAASVVAPTAVTRSWRTSASNRAGLLTGGLLVWLSGVAPDARPDRRRRRRQLRSGGAVLVAALFAGASVALAAGLTLRLPTGSVALVAAASAFAMLALDRRLTQSWPRKPRLRACVRFAAPRLLLGLSLAALGAMPVALLIFRPDIDRQLTVTQTVVTSTASQPQSAMAAIFAQGGLPSVSELIAQRAKSEQQIAELESAPPCGNLQPCAPGTAVADQEMLLEDKSNVSTDNNEIAEVRRLDPPADESRRTSTTITTGPGNASLLRRLLALKAVAPKHERRTAACLLLLALFAVLGCLPLPAGAIFRRASPLT